MTIQRMSSRGRPKAEVMLGMAMFTAVSSGAAMVPRPTTMSAASDLNGRCTRGLRVRLGDRGGSGNHSWLGTGAVARSRRGALAIGVGRNSEAYRTVKPAAGIRCTYGCRLLHPPSRRPYPCTLRHRAVEPA